MITTSAGGPPSSAAAASPAAPMPASFTRAAGHLAPGQRAQVTAESAPVPAAGQVVVAAERARPAPATASAARARPGRPGVTAATAAAAAAAAGPSTQGELLAAVVGPRPGAAPAGRPAGQRGVAAPGRRGGEGGAAGRGRRGPGRSGPGGRSSPCPATDLLARGACPRSVRLDVRWPARTVATTRGRAPGSARPRCCPGPLRSCRPCGRPAPRPGPRRPRSGRSSCPRCPRWISARRRCWRAARRSRCPVPIRWPSRPSRCRGPPCSAASARVIRPWLAGSESPPAAGCAGVITTASVAGTDGWRR